MARTDSTWTKVAGAYLKASLGLLVAGTNRYINFGSDYGSSGYGFRDNAGTIEFKNSGGSWAGFGSGGGGGGITTEQAVDAVAAAIAGGTHEIVITYDDAGNSFTYELAAATKASLTLADSALQVTDLVNTLTSTSVNAPLTAAQGKVLKDLIDTINTLLGSDTTTLDTLQEVVDFIELNRADLDALGISAIAGLQTALDAKQATLISGTNIRTVNGQSLLGSTNLVTPDTNTTYSEISEAEITAGTANTLRTMTGRRAGYLLGLVISRVLTGFSTASSAVVTAADTILGAIGKLQAQVTLRAVIVNTAMTGVATADRITFKQAKATVSAIGNSGASQALNADNATIFTCSLTGNTSFTFTNLASGDSIELHCYGDGTLRTPTFPTAKTLYNAATIAFPTLATDLLVFTARHNGTEVVISAAGNYAAFS